MRIKTRSTAAPTTGKAIAILIFALRCLASSFGNMGSLYQEQGGVPGSTRYPTLKLAAPAIRAVASVPRVKTSLMSLLFTRASRNATFSVPTSIRQHMECVFRSAGVNNSSYPGFHHLQCSEDLSPEQIVRIRFFYAYPNRISNLRRVPDVETFRTPPKGSAAIAQAAGLNLPQFRRNCKQRDRIQSQESRVKSHPQAPLPVQVLES